MTKKQEKITRRSLITGGLLFLGGAIVTQLEGVFSYFTEETLEDEHQLRPQQDAVEAFRQSSYIADCFIDNTDGRLYCQYYTENIPPMRTYDYEVLRNGIPLYDINRNPVVYGPLHTDSWRMIEEGKKWWGNNGYDGFIIGDEIKVAWLFHQSVNELLLDERDVVVQTCKVTRIDDKDKYGIRSPVQR